MAGVVCALRVVALVVALIVLLLHHFRNLIENLLLKINLKNKELCLTLFGKIILKIKNYGHLFKNLGFWGFGEIGRAHV